MESPQTKIPHKLDSQGKLPALPPKTCHLIQEETIVLVLVFFALCKGFIFLWKQEQRAGQEVVKQAFVRPGLRLEPGEASQEVAWQEDKSCCMNHAISQHFNGTPSAPCLQQSGPKRWDVQHLKWEALVVPTLPRGLLALTALQKHSLNFSSLGELLQSKAGLEQSPKVHRLCSLSAYSSCSALGQDCWGFGSEEG